MTGGGEGGAFTKKRLPNGGLDGGNGGGGVVRREVGFNTKRFYAKTTVRLEFFNVSLKAEISTKWTPTY